MRFTLTVADLFLEFLFKPGTKVNPDHKPKYVYLLAYASCVMEIWRKVRNLVFIYINGFLKNSFLCDLQIHFFFCVLKQLVKRCLSLCHSPQKIQI